MKVGLLNHLVGSSWHRWDSLMMQFVFLCHPQAAMVIGVIVFKLLRFLWRQGCSPTLDCAKHASSVFDAKTAVLVIVSFMIWNYRRTYGP